MESTFAAAGYQLAVPAVDCVAQNRELAALVLQSRKAFNAKCPQKMHGATSTRCPTVKPLTDSPLRDLARDVAAENVVASFTPGSPFADPHVEMIQRTAFTRTST